jgi:hypothetical protein
VIKRLEPLRKYATEPMDGTPPEILPWDRDDPWGLYNIARATLGLLLEGEKPGDRLFALADYLLTFNNEGYGPSIYNDAPLLNGTALALCGYLCDGAHPEAELWRITGCARLASEVHKRRAALDDRISAECLLAVCRVTDELELPILADLVTLRERMWGRLLDHSRVERLHVAEADYPSHMTEPVVPDKVGDLMRDRDWQCKVPAPDFWMQPDRQDADDTCNNLITLRAHMLVRHQFGGEIDWHLRLFDDKESTVSLNAQPFIRNLAWVYSETGDEKYALHAARLLWSFYQLCPVPNHHLWLGPWRTLEVGNRQCNMWPTVIACLGQTEPFEPATHAMLARSRLEHMRYLLAFCGGANNWYQVESAGLATAALFSPELRHADAYLRVALRRLKWINSFAYYDDGFQFELTHGYHVFPTSSMFAVVRAAQARQVELPSDFMKLVEKAHEMYLYAVQPNHVLPMFNDCNPNPTDPAPFLQAAAESFDRDDFLWGASHGAEGQAPDHTSHAWPSAGYYVMRDKWDEAGQYLCFDGAAWGASHQHEDKLTFVLYSHGRLLIGDPNIYSYARTELTHYFRSSRAHNVVLVDGRGQARRFRPEARLSTMGRNEWVSRDRFDFVSSEYLEGFAPDPYDLADQSLSVDAKITHRRAIFYVKPFDSAHDAPGYWILSDLIGGTDQELHRLEQLFHIPPLATGDAAEPLRAGNVSVFASAVLTQDEGMANLAILPVDGDGLAIRAQQGETSPAVGWYGVMGEFPAWDVTLEREAVLPARIDTVLFPMAHGETVQPKVRRLRTDIQVTAFQITGEGFDDTFVLCEEGTRPVTVADVTFEGRALLLRREPHLRALAVAPTSLTVAGVAFQADR